jgi:CBS domain-containing protein
MPGMKRTNVLSGLTVRDASRRMVASLPQSATIEHAIRYTIKFKINAVLITGDAMEALGVVSKTDLMTAYYAGLPTATILRQIMVGPPLFCGMHDPLDSALDIMFSNRVHRLYVHKHDNDPNRVVGVLAYPDIVGLLYRYCHRCERSVGRMKRFRPDEEDMETLKAMEVMTPAVEAYGEHSTLLEVMEGLAAHRFGAVLIHGEDRLPVGVISKTDLMIAYKHGIPVDASASQIMNGPVLSCEQREPLVSAIRKMIFSDVHRLFVHKNVPENMVGVLSLSDAARVRSGCCRACVTGRIRVEDGA